MKEALAVTAGVLALAASIPYMTDIIRGKTKPNIVTWITWSLLTAVGTFAAFAAHEPHTAYLTLGDMIANIITVILGLHYGIAKFTWFDGFCQVGAIAGLVLWFIFNSPEVAIIAVITIDFLGMIPTLRHSWLKPGEETWQTFGILIGASVLTLLSVTTYSIVSISFPLYLLLANVAVVFTVITSRKRLGLPLGR